MAYKKYIKRGGKTYGPYVYHSKKINGRVTSEYLGKYETKKRINLNIFIPVSIGLILLFFSFFVALNGKNFSESFQNIKGFVSGGFHFTGLAIDDNLTSSNISDETIPSEISNQTNETISSVEIINQSIASNETNINSSETNITAQENITQTPEINITIPEVNITITENITINETITNITETNITANITQENITANATIQTTQYQAVLGKPVKWIKEINPETAGNLTIILPKEAENISVTQIKDHEETQANVSITGAVIGTSHKSFILNFLEKIWGAITGHAIDEQTLPEKEVEIQIDDSQAQYNIEYETPAPYAIEQEIDNKKIVQIVGPDTIHYEDILSFTNINESFNVKDASKIKIHWVESNADVPIQKIEDTNGNGIYDYIEWVTPHLSNQTFEIIIEISKAEHLNNNKQFISDIYEQVKAQDDIWSETIPSDDYVRVTFQQNLTNQNDITLYPKIISGTPVIEVYEKDGTNKIAEFNPIISNDYNKIYLTNLPADYSQDTFDLKVSGGDLQLDYIVDPARLGTYYLNNITASSTLVFNTTAPTATTSIKNASITSRNITAGTVAIFNWTSDRTYPTSTVLVANTSTLVIFCNRTSMAGATAQYYANITNVTIWDCGASSTCATPTRVFQNNSPIATSAGSGGSQNGNCNSTGNNNNITITFGGAGGNYTIAAGNYLGIGIYVKAMNTTTNLWFGSSTLISRFNISEREATEQSPNITIVTPLNNTNWTLTTLDINFTVGDPSGLSSCWYSNDTFGIVNYSLGGAGFCTNITNITWSSATHNVTVYINDTFNNQNSSIIFFTVDTIPPSINITYPINNTNWSSTTINVNFTISDINLGTCWYSNTSGLINYTWGCNNITNVTWSLGQNNITVYVNDSVGNVNWSSVTFTIDTTSGTGNVSNCLTLNSTNTYYQLNTSISNNTITTDCIIISAQNITFDCDGYSISSSQNFTGVYSNQYNTTIKNCNISMGTGNNTASIGIEMTDAADYSTVINNTIIGNMYYGIQFGTGGNGPDYSLIGNNTIDVSQVTGGIGIYLQSSSNNTLTSNTGASRSNYAIYLYSSSNNTLTSNTGTSNSSAGISLLYSSNNTLTSNIGTSNSSVGIYLFSSSYNNLTSNTGTSNTNFGIRIWSSNNTLTSNIGTSNSSYGIVLWPSSSNNILTNNTGTSNLGQGIYLYSSVYNNLTSNTGISNSSYGIWIYNSSNNNLTSNTGTSNLSVGIYLQLSSNNNTLTNNIGISNSSYGIWMDSFSNYNILTNNTGTSNSSRGIYLYNSSNNNLTLNKGTSNSSQAIFIQFYSNNNILTNNTGTSNSGPGIVLQSSSNNNLTSNTGTSNSSNGIYLYDSSNNNTLTSNTGTSNSSRGIYLTSSNNNTLINNTGTSNSDYGIFIEGSLNNTLISNTGTSNSLHGILISSSSNNTLTFNTGISNSSVGIYLWRSSNNTLTNNLGRSNSSYGMRLDNSTSNNLTSNTGISISNVGILIYLSSNNNILTSNLGTSNSSVGIYLQLSSNNNLTSNTGTSNSGYGIYLYNTSNNNILTNNTGISNSSAGIYLYLSSNNNILTNNNGTSNSNVGIYLNSFSNNNVLTNNNGTSNSSIGIYLGTSSNNTLTNNIGTSNSSYGIQLQAGSSNNTLTSNIGTSDSGIGIYLFNSSNNNLTNNNGTARVGTGIQIQIYSNNNILTGNRGTSILSAGIYMENSSNNNLTSNTGTSNSTQGFYILSFSNNNTLISNTGTSNASYGIYLYSSSNNILTNMRAEGYLTGSYGIAFRNSNNTIIQDCVNISGVSGDVLYVTATSSNNTFINCSYRTTGTNETVLAGGSLTRKWYYGAYVNDTTGIAINNANVTAYNVTGSMEFSELMTNSSGWTNITTITEYVNNGGTRQYYNNYTINTIATGYNTGTKSENITILTNQLYDIITLTTDTTSPLISITTPTNNTNTSNTQLNVNFTVSDNVGISRVWYTNNSGLTNQTITFGQNITGVTWIEGINNISVYANDTSGNINVSYVTFTIDTIAPNINFTSPTPANATTQSSTSVYVNVSTSDTNEHSAFIDWNNSLVGWWNFESVLANGTVYDNSSWGNNGLMSGFSSNTTVSGKRGKAIEFDGANDALNINSLSNASFPSTGTLSFWIKANCTSQQTNDGNIFDNYDSVRNHFFIRCIGNSSTSGNLQIAAQNNTGSYVSGYTGNVSNINWDYITIAYNSTTARYYISGNLMLQQAYSSPWIPNNQTVRFGQSFSGAFNGTIDEVMIFNRALSAQEINASYQAGTYKLYNNFTNLTDASYTYKAYAIDAAGNINTTETRNVTVDTTFPSISIIYPPNSTGTRNNNLNINYTISDLNGLSACWYSNDTYSANTSLASCSTNITTLTWAEGIHNVRVYVNDTSNNINSSQVTFTIDTIFPSINFTSPTPANATAQSSTSVYVNVSTSDTNEHSAFIDWNNSLVGWWNFESVLANGTVYDNSSWGNNGLMNGFSSNTTVSGKRGQALQFDGVNDYVGVLDSDSLDAGTGSFSYGAFIKTEAFSTARILSKRLGGGAPFTGYELAINSTGNLFCTLDDGTTNYLEMISKSAFKDNLWHHVMCVIDREGGTLKFYIDGVLVPTRINYGTNNISLYSSLSNINNLSVARFSPSSTNFFNGSIDEVMIFNRALSAQEINASYQAGTYKLYNNFTNLTEGSYTYKAYAIDLAGNINSTEQRSVTVFTINSTEFTGSSTNLNQYNYTELQNLSNLTLEDTSNGKIQFSENINLTDDADTSTSNINLNSYINISFNRIELNSTALPNMNKSATLSLYGLNFTTPRILRDGSVCSSAICTQESYSGGVLKFNVTHFTVYSSEETPVEAGGNGGSGGGAGTSSSVTSTAPECTKNSDCKSADEVCWKDKCVKLFDVKITDFKSPVELGSFFDFTYYLKGMADINDDVQVNFWIQNNKGEKITTGSDTIYLGSFEEKTEQSKIFLPTRTESGVYEFYVEVANKAYTAQSHRTIEITVNGNVATIKFQELQSLKIIGLIILALLSILVISLVIINLRKRRHIVPIQKEIKQAPVIKEKQKVIIQKLPETRYAPAKKRILMKFFRNIFYEIRNFVSRLSNSYRNNKIKRQELRLQRQNRNQNQRQIIQEANKVQLVREGFSVRNILTGIKVLFIRIVYGFSLFPHNLLKFFKKITRTETAQDLIDEQ